MIAASRLYTSELHTGILLLRFLQYSAIHIVVYTKEMAEIIRKVWKHTISNSATV